MNKGFLIIDAQNNVLYVPADRLNGFMDDCVRDARFSVRLLLPTVERCQVKSGVRLAVARYLKAKTEEEYYELKKKEEAHDQNIH